MQDDNIDDAPGCGTCAGSGEGWYPGSRCARCGGSGVCAPDFGSYEAEDCDDGEAWESP